MLVIQHRANNLSDPALTSAAEVDVHIDMNGNILVKHNPDESGWLLDYFLRNSKHEKFFVDIKQNMAVSYYEKIIDAFGDRLIGIFDVPMPAAYFLAKEGIEFYSRLSEIELPCSMWNEYWLDPLVNWSPSSYQATCQDLFVDKSKVIVACPSLHGRNIEECLAVWEWAIGRNVRGIVTKHVKELREVIDA